MYNLLLIKDLKLTAQKEIEEYDKIHNRKSFVPAMFGHPATNKKWLDSAKNNYIKFQRASLNEKLIYLLNAFVDIIKCEILMQERKFKDENVCILKQKIQTSYINFIITFIEENIYDNTLIEQNSDSLKIAIEILSEENPKLAKNYSQMLKNHIDGYKKHIRLMGLFNENHADFTPDISYRINVLYSSNKDFYAKNEDEKKLFLKNLQEATNHIFYAKNQLYLRAKNKKTPNIREIISLIDDLVMTLEPLNLIINNINLDVFFIEKNHLNFILEESEKYYPDLKKTYSYLSLPREKIDLRRLFHSRNILKKISNIIEENFEEIQNQNPTFTEIRNRIESSLEAYFKSDLNQYYKIFNTISDLFIFEEKFIEMMRFKENLTIRINDMRITSYVKEKLSEMKNELEEEIEELLESNLIENLRRSSSIVDFKKTFEKQIENYLKYGSDDLLRKITQKKKILLSNISFENADTKHKIHSIIDKVFSEDIDENEFLSPEEEDFDDEIPPIKRLIIVDNFTLKNFIIFFKDTVKIGRKDENDIVLPAKWVSSFHCEVNLSNQLLIDFKSTNGTFLNFENEKISQIDLSEVTSFSIGNIFHFSLEKDKSAVFINFLQLDDLKKEIDNNLVFALKNTTFVLTNEKSIIIDKSEGKKIHQFSENERYINIALAKNGIIVDGKKYDDLTDIIHIDDRFSITL